MKMMCERTQFEEIDLLKMKIGDTYRVDLVGYISGTCGLLITKTGKTKISVIREFWFKKEKKNENNV